MSTDFYCPQLDSTDDTRFVQYARSSPKTGEAPSWEFGTERNFDEVLNMLEMGLTFVGLGDSGKWAPQTRAGWIKALADGRVTFGVFPFTTAFLSESYFRMNEDSWKESE